MEHVDIQAALERLLVGQSRAKTALSRLIQMHFSWFNSTDRLHKAPNALMIGPTGTGKTHAITVAAEAQRTPLVIVDSTRLVAAGATQQLTFEQIMLQLIKSARQLIEANEDLKYSPEYLAERGVIFLDEFDKLWYENETHPNAAIQRRLLQFVEGETVFLDADERETPRTISTHGILFVASGAFSGVRSKAVTSERRHSTSRAPDIGKTIQHQDFEWFGFLRELVARLPVMIRFDSLSVEDLLAILDHKEVSPLIFYERYFSENNLKLQVPSETRQLIAEEASVAELGARGLHQEVFPALSALAGELPAHIGGTFVLTPSEYNRLKSAALQ